jgi:hypothetical protein
MAVDIVLLSSERNNSHENQEISILVIKKAKTKSCLFLEVNERLPHKGLTEPGRRNSTEGMNWNKEIRTSSMNKN